MNAAPTRPPYLFYSPKCPHCNQLIEMIKRNQQLARSIEPINVHTANGLPPQLDGVPAILFRGQLLVGPDTFKWVQMQTPQDNRPQGSSGMPDHPSTSGGLGGNMQEGDLEGIPSPADISGATKCGIDFTPLPGQQENKTDTTIPRFSFLSGEGSNVDGTQGIDYAAAMEDTSQNDRKAGMDQAMKQLQSLRGNDQNAINQAMGGGPYQQYQQQAPWQQGQQGQQAPQGYMQGQQAPQGYMNQGGQQAPQGYMQGGQQGFQQPQQSYQQPQAPAYGSQNGYMQQEPQGYGNMHQQQQAQYGGNNALPKRF